jgi:hypothetical protein
VDQQRRKRITLQVPNFNSTIVCNTCKHWRCIWRPVYIINLLFKCLNLVANKLWCWLSGVPNSHCPVIRTCKEDWAIFFVPERVASYSVDWTCVARVSE